MTIAEFNPFTTEPRAIFLLIENDNLGIIILKFIKIQLLLWNFLLHIKLTHILKSSIGHMILTPFLLQFE